MAQQGTWNRYQQVRGEYLALIRAIRAAGPESKDWRYLDGLRRELVACRNTHYASGRQARYNRQFAGCGQ